MSVCVCLCLSVSVYVCLSLSVYLSICKLENEAILRVYPQCLILTTFKTQLFCETSSSFELDNVKNEAILRELWSFFQAWQYQIRFNSAMTSFKNGKLSAELTASYQCVLRFFHSTCLKYCACHEKWCQVIRNAAPVTQNHLSKPEDLMLQNATPLRKSTPSPPNSSDEHVSTAPATENASLQILFKCHACHRFWKCYKTLTFCSLLTRCIIPCACRHLSLQKWSEHVVFLTFWLRHVLRATTACNFSSLIWLAGSAPAALASLLFDPPAPQIIGKTQCFATFLPFRAPGSSFFWVFLLIDLLSSSLLFSSLLFSSLLFYSLLASSLALPTSAFHLNIVGSLTSKLPSNIDNDMGNESGY